MPPTLTPLGRYLREWWQARGMRQADFARRVGVRSSHIHLVKTGQRKPPLKDYHEWASALELEEPAERERLLELMRLGHSLTDIQERYELMRALLKGRGRRVPPPRNGKPG